MNPAPAAPLAAALALLLLTSGGPGRAAEAAAPTIAAYSANYAGTIGDKNIAVSIDRFAGQITGSYFYAGNGKHPLTLKGTVSGDAFAADETVGGRLTGRWHGRLTPGSIDGTWSSPDGTKTWKLHAADASHGKAFPYDIRLELTAGVDRASVIKNQLGGGCSADGKATAVAAVELIDPATGHVVQTLGGDVAGVLSQGTCTMFVPIVEDMNFDGWPDLRIAQFLPASPNIPYAAWLFDPATRNLAASDDLEEIASPAFDPAAKRVTSAVRNSCCSYTNEVYAWHKGHLRLVEKTDIDYLPPDAAPAGKNCYVEKRYKLLDGKMALVKTTKGCDKS